MNARFQERLPPRFVVHAELVTFAEAVEQCEALGMELAVPRSPEESIQLSSMSDAGRRAVAGRVREVDGHHAGDFGHDVANAHKFARARCAAAGAGSGARASATPPRTCTRTQRPSETRSSIKPAERLPQGRSILSLSLPGAGKLKQKRLLW